MLGLEVAKNFQDVKRIDKDEGNDDWNAARLKEINKLLAMRFGQLCPKEWTPPQGFKHYLLHFYYELKHDLRKKARLVSGGNRIDSFVHQTSSSMVRLARIRLLLVIAAANNLKVRTGDIENACVWAPCGENV